MVVSLGVDGKLMGHLVMADALRSGTAELLAGLRRLGIGRILLATGDRRAVAEAVTDGLGLDAVRSELTPDQKVLLVLTERKNGPVMMVGDGVNDAPALAAADIGVAMGARGAAASAEAADVVLLVDHLDRLLPGIEVAQRSRRIALESVAAGIGLSVAGMIAAALGYLTPVQGALAPGTDRRCRHSERASCIEDRTKAGDKARKPATWEPRTATFEGALRMSRLRIPKFTWCIALAGCARRCWGRMTVSSSTASLVVGVAAAGSGRAEILIAGLAGLVAGAMSMAAGEYVSVSSQTDAEQADIGRETGNFGKRPRPNSRS